MASLGIVSSTRINLKQHFQGTMCFVFYTFPHSTTLSHLKTQLANAQRSKFNTMTNLNQIPAYTVIALVVVTITTLIRHLAVLQGDKSKNSKMNAIFNFKNR